MDKTVSEIFKDAVLKSLSQYSKNGESLQVCCAEIPVKSVFYCCSIHENLLVLGLRIT